MIRRTSLCRYCGFTGILDGDIVCPCPRGDRYWDDPSAHEDLHTIKGKQRRRRLASHSTHPAPTPRRNRLLRFLLGEHRD